MKTQTAILLASLAALAPAMADILYVNNDTAYPADYRTFDEAFAAAAPNDTIMLAGSTTSYGDIVIVGKPVKVVGNKSANVSASAPGQPARADELTTIVDNVKVGKDSTATNDTSVTETRLQANGTILESLTGFGMYIWSNQCTIRRCNDFYSSSYDIHLMGSGNLVSECQFRQAHLDRAVNTGVDPNHVAPGTGNLFQNCIFEFAGIRLDSFTSGVFLHCIIDNSRPPSTGASSSVSSAATATLRNCIIGDRSTGSVKTAFNGGSTRLHHCLIVGSSGAAQIPSQSADLNNIVEPDPTVVYDEEAGWWQLAAGSPALGAGENGEDLGLYDGPAPFQWGGSPALPLVNKLKILSADPTTGLTFEVKAEARD